MTDAARVSRSNLKKFFITRYSENAIFRRDHLELGRAVLMKQFFLEIIATRARSMKKLKYK